MDWTGFDAWLRAAPLPLLAGSLIACVAAAILAGAVLRTRFKPPADEEAARFVVSSVLGLLALLLGFTFAMAIDRFDARRVMVLNEANAIGTTYLRTQLLDEPHRSRISDILVRYTDNRIRLAEAPPAETSPLLAVNDRLVEDFWGAVAAAFPTIKHLDFSSAYLESANTLIDLDAARKAGRRARVPGEVFAVLAFYVIVSAGVLGFTAVNQRALGFAALFLALLTLSLLLTIDIDRPTVGGIRESQSPMHDLLVTLRQRELERVRAQQQDSVRP